MFEAGEIVDTITQGFLTVISPITITHNNTHKYNLVGGRTLYWMQDLDSNDIFYWDHELENILTDNEKELSKEICD